MSLLTTRYIDIISCLLLIALFMLFPTIDLAFSQLFYDTKHNSWIYGNLPIITFIYKLILFLPYLLIPLFLGMSIYSFVTRRAKIHKQRKIWLFLLLALLLGPGLVVHEVFKQNFDRPRPRDTIEFAGKYPFTPAFSNAQECQNCRSFVSGHAAMGGFLLALVFIFRHKALLYLALNIAILIGLARVLQGGHYLSDIIFANYACYFIYRILSYKLLGHSQMLPRTEKTKD